MGNYKINFNISIEDIMDSTNNATVNIEKEITEEQATSIDGIDKELAGKILEDNSFTKEGKPADNMVIYRPAKEILSLPPETVEAALADYNERKVEHQTIDAYAAQEFYEDPETVVNISIDDVGVKSEKEKGRSPDKTRKPKKECVYNTVAHIESVGNRYIMNAVNTLAIIPLLIAVPLHNQLLRRLIAFFVDGASDLQNAIINEFCSLKSYSIILHWYHLKKKCQYELSLVLKGSKYRNSVLIELLPVLWLGKIEKANDLVVSDRQKHNGMSWSKDSSVALATIKSLHLNKEHENRYCNAEINLSLFHKGFEKLNILHNPYYYNIRFVQYTHLLRTTKGRFYRNTLQKIFYYPMCQRQT